MTLRAALAAVGLVALLGSATAHAAATQSLDSVRAAAEQAMQDRYSRPGSRVVVSTEPLDTRLQLDACSEPLRALVSDQAQPRSRMTVPVQCPQPGGWIVRVPIHLQVFRQVLVSSRALLRGDGIGAADVHVEERDVTRLGYGSTRSPAARCHAHWRAAACSARAAWAGDAWCAPATTCRCWRSSKASRCAPKGWRWAAATTAPACACATRHRAG